MRQIPVTVCRRGILSRVDIRSLNRRELGEVLDRLTLDQTQRLVWALTVQWQEEPPAGIPRSFDWAQVMPSDFERP
jgi:hypothetical protein